MVIAVVVARLTTHVAGGVEGLYIEGGVVGEGGVKGGFQSVFEV